MRVRVRMRVRGSKTGGGERGGGGGGGGAKRGGGGGGGGGGGEGGAGHRSWTNGASDWRGMVILIKRN